jgi:F-type H+-transporting ATPase subunit gamma
MADQGSARQGMAVSACEPSPEAVFDEFFPLYIQARVRQVLSSSYASELAARMTAMDSASRNAQKLIDEFTLTMNNVRQSGITRELSEIIGASEVFK